MDSTEVLNRTGRPFDVSFAFVVVFFFYRSVVG